MRWFFPFALFLLLASAFSADRPAVFADVSNCNSDVPAGRDDLLQQRLQQCQAEIQVQQGLLQETQRQSTTLERDIAILDYRISKAKLEIRARTLTIAQLGETIAKKNETIKNLGDQIVQLMNSAGELVRKTQQFDSLSIAQALFADQQLSDFFADVDSFNSVERQLQTTVSEIRQNKTSTEAARELLTQKQDQARALKAVQELEQQKTLKIQEQKQQVLTETKGQEQKYQTILDQKQQILHDIQNKILHLVGGGELKFPEALKLVRVAESKLGIRAAFVLAVLTQESGIDGVIGKNVGKCFYNTPWNNSSGTVMSDDQKPSFLSLLSLLGRDPVTTPVSCPIASAGPYGGAMGPAQFMPKTWWDADTQTGYKTRVEEITGNAPASPFVNLDAFTGTAIYLNDGLTGCDAIYATEHVREECAAAKYYAGAKWRRYLKTYGARVAARADAYQKDIDVLDSQS